MSERLLLHTCCAPCATAAVPWWRAEGLEPLALFLNPNIQPGPEYARRLATLYRFAERADLELSVRDDPGDEEWARAVGARLVSGDVELRPLADDRDDGPGTAAAARCRQCVRLRLRESAWEAAARGVGRFSTTLSLSPYQRHDIIVSEGLAAADEAGVEFVYADLRRYYRTSIDESRRLGLYRQPYCGCVPSKWEAWHQRRERRRVRHGRAAA